MKLASFEAVVRALNDAGVRFIVVGGVAVAAHGFLRHTRDIDLVIDLTSENALKALGALGTLGYEPRIPVRPSDFADPEQRARWIHEKGMVVLNLFSDKHRETPVDIFVTEPFDFPVELGGAVIKELAPGITVPIVSLKTLLDLKQAAGRPQDLVDIDQLRLRQS